MRGLFLGFSDHFKKLAESFFECDFEPMSGVYDILAIGENGFEGTVNYITASTVLCPQYAPCTLCVDCDRIASCGMGSKSTFLFTVLCEESAMFAINRKIYFDDMVIDECEYRVPFYDFISIYENIVYNALQIISKAFNVEKIS